MILIFRKFARVFRIEGEPLIRGENVTYVFKDKWKDSSRDSRREEHSKWVFIRRFRRNYTDLHSQYKFYMG